MGIVRVDHLEVLSSDIDRTLDFYVNTLGFTLWRRTESERDDGSSLQLACVRLGDFMPFLGLNGPPPRPSSIGVTAIQPNRLNVGTWGLTNRIACFRRHRAGDPIPDQHAKHQGCCQPKPSSCVHIHFAFRFRLSWGNEASAENRHVFADAVS